jgi:hypothetical protein
VRGVPENNVNTTFPADQRAARSVYVALAQYVRIFGPEKSEEKYNVKSFVGYVPARHEVYIVGGNGVYFRPDWANNY